MLHPDGKESDAGFFDAKDLQIFVSHLRELDEVFGLAVHVGPGVREADEAPILGREGR